MAQLPRIAVTMGDPSGVGPEICLDLLADEAVASRCVPVVVGDSAVLERCAGRTGKRMPGRIITAAELDSADSPAVLDTGDETGGFEPATVSAAAGRAGYGFVIDAIDLAMAGRVDAVATAPLNKEALRAAGISQPGHTEILAERTGADRYCMMQVSDEVTCSFVTAHVGYREVPDLLTEERIVEVIELTREAMRRIRGVDEPKLVVCGLNPHAGEHGLFGDGEEERIIAPAMESARTKGARLEGPLPPDTAFLDWRRAETDAFICMYHDQGHIPLKALAFDRAVNTTLGLPIIRTSVDHGTAFDIAWQGKANPRSLVEAVLLAARLAE